LAELTVPIRLIASEYPLNTSILYEVLYEVFYEVSYEILYAEYGTHYETSYGTSYEMSYGTSISLEGIQHKGWTNMTLI
jgi:hypothetical protein